ncbi:hypothetical protein AB9K34_15920 [Sedimentitalea sp. XS_ASV28]|uniref:hypothetical protein n=1 Tax=Sedimentitalea sp. XS_ASV28 TaxID=3241296 RepID=UPI0035147DA4
MRTDLLHPLFVVALLWGWAVPALSQPAASDAWTRRKCDLYGAAWQAVLGGYDMTGIRTGFVEKHQSFIDLGCPEDMRVCAATPEEIRLADVMTILSMNEGMASTFVPFGCPDRERDRP